MPMGWWLQSLVGVELTVNPPTRHPGLRVGVGRGEGHVAGAGVGGALDVCWGSFEKVFEPIDHSQMICWKEVVDVNRATQQFPLVNRQDMGQWRFNETFWPWTFKRKVGGIEPAFGTGSESTHAAHLAKRFAGGFWAAVWAARAATCWSWMALSCHQGHSLTELQAEMSLVDMRDWACAACHEGRR